MSLACEICFRRRAVVDGVCKICYESKREESVPLTALDDGAFGPKRGESNIDGERWTFALNEGITTES
jgi:hypothetical protein